jgi:D-alanyl-lipoteichoic acid acyltransferase DltB (MBOAT superfamily)
MMPQFRLPESYRPHFENFAVGITIFLIGLFKKAVLADGIAVHATPTFDAAAGGAGPDLFAAWSAALAYTFQLYFDFSGYTDMAIGAARLFGITLPLNFNSPYKATSIIDFWRRWHMTLSRFLRDYLYVALGGNRKGEARRFANLFITMLLGGLWHGAGWQFLLWGALHGAYLTVNHAWRAVAPVALREARWWRPLAWALTFLAVVVAWVPFRAADLETAGRVLAGMAGINGIVVPAALARILPQAEALGVSMIAGGGSAFVAAWLWIAALLVAALAFPNTQEIMGRVRPALGHDGRTGGLVWRPSRRWAMATATVAALGLLSLAQVSEFLYFQF